MTWAIGDRCWVDGRFGIVVKPIRATAVSDFGPLVRYGWVYGAAVYRYATARHPADFLVWPLDQLGRAKECS